MRRIREVLRLRAELGSNLSAIATGVRLARSTVRAYLARAAAAGLEAGAEVELIVGPAVRRGRTGRPLITLMRSLLLLRACGQPWLQVANTPDWSCRGLTTSSTAQTLASDGRVRCCCP
jgi:hypothetical protein